MARLVVFDVFELVPGAGKSIGIYNYAKNLWLALQAAPVDGVRWCVLCNAANAGDFDVVGDPMRFRQHVVGSSAPGKIVRQFWQRGGAAWTALRLKADGYFSPKGFLPAGMSLAMRGGPAVVVIHDLIPLWYRDVLPGYFGRVEEALVNGGLLKAARHANAVVAISEATAIDIKHRTGRSAGVEVVHNGIPYNPAAGRPRAEPYLFAVSSRLPHKNLQGLLDGYQAYRATSAAPLPLVVCGLDSSDIPGVEGVRNISDAALHTYYAHAEAVLFLSHIEGFGFPPVEAMLHGTRVLCSDIPSLREVTRERAVYADQRDPKAVAAALIALLNDAQAADFEAAEERRQAARSFTWERCAQGVSQVVARCLN